MRSGERTPLANSGDPNSRRKLQEGVIPEAVSHRVASDELIPGGTVWYSRRTRRQALSEHLTGPIA